MRGFLQVSSAMALPAHVVELHPMDMHSILARLAMRKERHGPRSLRFFLEPDKPVRVLIEPWGEVLEFRRSIYKGTTGAEIRLWGRRRLAILARALPLAKSVRLHLLGTGLPSFAVVDYGGLRFTLGLSGWTSNDWSRAGQFDLLAPRREVDEVTAQRVFDALKGRHSADVASLAAATAVDGSLVAAALTAYTQAGRVMYDLDKQVFRLRELAREPLPMGALRFASPQEEKADRFIAANLVTIATVAERDGRRVIDGPGARQRQALQTHDRAGRRRPPRGCALRLLLLRPQQAHARPMRAHAGPAPALSRTRRMKSLSLRDITSMVSPIGGVRRSGPCITGGVSPSWYHAWQSVTGPLFTGPALPQMSISQCGFLEPELDIWGRPASSGPSQSHDLTKACQRTPPACPSASILEVRP